MSRCFSIFDILENPEHDSFFQSFTVRKVEERGIVCDANTIGNEVFIVLSGELRVYLSYEGREFTVFTLEPEAVFTTHSSMMVVAKKPSEILVTSIKNFSEALTTIPGLSVSIIASMGRGLANTVRIIEGLVFRDVKHRLIHFLIDLANERGCKVQGGISVTMDYNTEDIATLIGSSRQSTSLILNELIKGGYLLRVSRKQLIIRDLGVLEHQAENNDLPPPLDWDEKPVRTPALRYGTGGKARVV
ncbi:Crp/Fnr family transcriptional regulator [Telmatospirillum sp.]|uniref:Crp/Fnr family transcriptional regulator n=1 Tax=Telmatospirillum sp. TaxID=2079197 RepID=UPI00284AD3DA|nr:Crp/Fnr family transcriptional regulator [Telmatospirillum sp.]MDR3435496.1 Crp/Fnr family transcriptional regulator [Telmatospirillum sp.]